MVCVSACVGGRGGGQKKVVELRSEAKEKQRRKEVGQKEREM